MFKREKSESNALSGCGTPKAVATIRCQGERIMARKREIPAPTAPAGKTVEGKEEACDWRGLAKWGV